MENMKKTKAQLIAELEKLRKRVAEREAFETEGKKTEKMFKETADYLQNLIDNANAPIIVWDTEFKITRFNHVFENLTQRSAEEVLTKTLDILFPESSCEQSMDLIRRIANGEKWETVEIPIHRKDGTVRSVLWNSANIYASDEARVIATIAQGQDITERKKAEEELRQSQQRYRLITEAVTDYIFTVYIEDGRPVKTVHNPSCIAVTGYTPEEFASDSYLWIKMIYKDDREAVKEQISSLFSGQNVFPVEHRIVCKDGIIHWVRATLVPHYDTQGNLISYDGLIRDITERKLAEMALRESDDSLSEAQRIAHIGSWEWNLITRRIRMSNEAYRIYGLDPHENELISKELIDFVHPDDKELVSKSVEDALHKDKPYDIVYHIVRSDGEERYIHENVEFKFDENSCIVRMIGTIQDITERKLAEIELQKREAFNYALFEYNPTETIIVDRDGKVLKCNLAKKESGYRLPNIGDIMYKDYAGKHDIEMNAELMNCIRKNEVKRFPEQKYEDKYLSITLSPFSEGAIIISEDITERKKAENALIQNQLELESKLKMERIISEIASQLNSTDIFQEVIEDILKYIAKEIDLKSVCIHIFDPVTTQTRPLFTSSSSICSFNPQNKTYKCPFIIYSIIENIIAGKIYNSSNLAELDKKERNYLKKKDFASIFTLPIKIGRKVSGMVNFSNDHEHIWNREERKLFKTMTEIIANAWERDYHSRARIEAEKKRSEALQMAERSSRLASLGTLTAGIAHEINQPLASLKVTVDGMLYWKEQGHKVPEDDLFNNLRFISEQGERIDDIIKNMRVLAREEKGAEPKPFDINNIIKRSLVLVKQQLSAHGIKVKMNCDHSLPLIRGYPTQIQQVVSNLLVNAMDAHDEHTRMDKVISISTFFSEGNCILEVFDNGPGIPEENFNQLFDPFFTTKVGSERMGLGLFITHNIITALGGTISAENREEGGARFIVTIPVAEKTAEECE